MALALEERLWNLLLQQQKASEASNVSGVPLNCGLKRQLCEAVNVKPELPWKFHDVGGARAM